MVKDKSSFEPITHHNLLRAHSSRIFALTLCPSNYIERSLFEINQKHDTLYCDIDRNKLSLVLVERTLLIYFVVRHNSNIKSLSKLWIVRINLNKFIHVLIEYFLLFTIQYIRTIFHDQKSLNFLGIRYHSWNWNYY